MKKTFSKILLVLIPFVIGFTITVGCSQSTDSASDTDNTPPAPTTPPAAAYCTGDSNYFNGYTVVPCPAGTICNPDAPGGSLCVPLCTADADCPANALCTIGEGCVCQEGYHWNSTHNRCVAN